MRPPPTYTTWKITCPSSEEVQALQQWLSRRIDLERVLTDTVRVILNGVDQVQTVRHRLGDYFAAIRILPDAPANPASFRLVFRRRPEAGRFWKDLMVNILQEIETTHQKAAIELESKGEMEPITPATGHVSKISGLDNSLDGSSMAANSLQVVRSTLETLRATFHGISSRHDRAFCQWIIAEDSYRDRLGGHNRSEWSENNLIAARGFTIREPDVRFVSAGERQQIVDQRPAAQFSSNSAGEPVYY